MIRNLVRLIRTCIFGSNRPSSRVNSRLAELHSEAESYQPLSIADQKASHQHQHQQHHDVIITSIFLAAIFPELYTQQ